MFNPFDSTLTVIKIIGVGLIIYAVMDIIAFVQVKKVAKVIDRAVNSGDEVDSDAEER
ncbi:MAG: hypothetical protein LUG95_06525 [Clostridiales bacterium]|nr:hypothetical protein [Clostridiales bacterium]